MPVSYCKPGIFKPIALQPQSTISTFHKTFQKFIHLTIISWSVEFADAFQELHDLFADKLDATTDDERQDLDNQIETHKTQIKANENLQQK